MSKLKIGKCIAVTVSCFWMFTVSVRAHKDAVDSLRAELRIEREDTSRVMLYNNLAREIANTTQRNPISDRNKYYNIALQYADSGLFLAQNINYRRGEAELLRTLGAAYFFLNDYDRAISYYNLAFDVSSELNDEYAKAALMYNIAMIYREQGKNIQALKHNFIAASIWEKIGRKELLQKTNARISSIYGEIGENELSIEHARKSIDLAFELNDTLAAASLFDVIGGTYLSLGDTVSGTDAYEKSLELYRAKKDTASEARVLFNYAANMKSMPLAQRKEMLLQSKKIFEQHDPEHHNLAIVYRELSITYRSDGKDDSARYYKDKALKQALLAKHYPTLSIIYSAAADDALANKQLDQAEAYYNAAHETNKRVESAKVEQAVHDGLFQVYRQRGDHKRAYEIMQESIHMKDSLAVEESRKRLELLHMQYELKTDQEKREAEWKLQADAQERTIKRRRVAIVSILITLGLLAALSAKIIYNYRVGKYNNVLLQERHEEILQIQEELRQSNDELSMYKEYLEEMVHQQTVEQADKDRQLRTMSDNLAGGFIYRKVTTADGRGHFSYVGGNVDRLIGISAEEMEKYGKYSFLPEDDHELIRKIEEKEKESLAEMKPLTFEFPFVKDGQHKWLYDHSLPHEGTNGDVVWDGFVIDITKQKEVQNSLEEAKEGAEESDRLKSVFLSNMSHEIRTPMNAILGFVGYLENESLSDDKRSKFIEIINKSVDRLMKLIGNIIDISKLEVHQFSIHPNKFELNALMRELKRDYAHSAESGKLLDIVLDDNRFVDSDMVSNDRERLKQVLSGLIDNAVKYTDKGYVRFGYEPAEDPSDLLFFVEDTGIGVPEDQREIIFEYFRQGVNTELKPQYGGTGLGLSISKALIERMGGRIWLESTEGKGSTFYFTVRRNL